MKYIASGYQYDVFDLGNGRVSKQKRNYFGRLWKMFQVFQRENLGLLAALRKALATNAESVRVTLAIRRMLAPELAPLLGNPVFKEGISYEQDKVAMTEDYLPAHTLEENKRLIDDYVRLRFKLWQFGIHDYVFKFKGNHGVTPKGEIALIDFNELYLTKEEAMENLKTQKWLSLPQYKKWPEGELKDYYTNAMAAAMTPNMLEANWMKAI